MFVSANTVTLDSDYLKFSFFHYDFFSNFHPLISIKIVIFQFPEKCVLKFSQQPLLNHSWSFLCLFRQEKYGKLVEETGSKCKNVL